MNQSTMALGLLVALSALGCRSQCEAKDSNLVQGEGSVTVRVAHPDTDSPTEYACTATVAGGVSDEMGVSGVASRCAIRTGGDRTEEYVLELDLGDPRTLDERSIVTMRNVGYQRLYDDVRVEVLESAGMAAPWPAAVTDDFVRRVRVQGRTDPDPMFGVTEGVAEITIRASDLRTRDVDCPIDSPLGL